MAFLHGVLDNIQPKLGQHKGTLTSALNLLKDTNDNGITKYKAAIAEVASGVHTYNEKVAASNDAVKSVITRLQYDVGRRFRDEIEEAVRQVDMKLGDCKTNAQTFITNMTSTHLNTADLNFDCKTKIDRAIKNIAHEGKRLLSLWGKEKKDLDEMEKQIRGTFDFLKTGVNAVNTSQVNELVEKLKWKVAAIRVQIEGIGVILENRIKELENWKEEAAKLVDGTGKVAGEIERKDPGKINYDEILGKEKELEDILAALDDNVNRFKGDVKAAATKGEELVKGFDKVLQTDLKVLEGYIEGAIKEYVEKLKSGHFGKIKKGVGNRERPLEGNDESIDACWEKLKQEITGLVGEVIGKEPGPKKYDGLKGIKQKVKEYAQFFTQESFESTVQGWIKTILEKNEIVIERIGYYISYDHNKTHFVHEKVKQQGKDAIDDEFRKPIAKRIKEEIKSKLNDKFWEPKKVKQPVDAEHPYSITKNVAFVQEVCDNFAKELGEQIKNGGKITASGIAEQIKNDKDVVAESHRKQHVEYHLTHAVQFILAALQSNARRVAKTLESFTSTKDGTYHLGSNLELAISRVETIKNMFGDETGKGRPNEPGSKIKMALTSVKASISELDRSMEKDLKAAVAGAFGDALKSKDNPAEVRNLMIGYGVHIRNIFIDSVHAINHRSLSFNVDKTKGALDNLSSDIKEHLNALTNSFSNVGKDLRGKLMDFKNYKLEGSLIVIKNKIQHLISTELAEVTKAAHAFEKQANDLRESTTITLTDYVRSQVTIAQIDITTHARKQYVSSIQLLLNQFSERVSSELGPLPAAIDTDRREGFKGFMRTFEGKMTDNATTDENIKKLKDLASESADTAEQKATLFKTLSTKFKEFFGPLKGYLDTEIMRLYKDSNAKKNPPVIIKDTDKHPYADALDTVQSKLNTLLDELHSSNHFTHSLTINLGNLSSALHSLVPTNFEGPCNTLPDVIKSGLRDFHDELEKAYVSVYDAEPWKSEHSDKYAKIYFTLLKTVCHDLIRLREHCDGDCKDKKICLLEMSDRKQIANPLGQWLDKRGFTVSNSPDKQNGELNKEKNSDAITNLLDAPIDKSQDNLHLQQCISKKDTGFPVMDILDCLFDHLIQYNKTSHLIIPISPKSPSSVNDMLQWLVGLRYNPMCQPVVSAFNGLFSDAEKGLAVTAPHDVLRMIPNSTLRPNTLAGTLTAVCRQAEKTLTAIQGYGHSDGRYACEYANNSRNLIYPTNPAACMDMLIDILCRLQQQLCFLYRQCCVTSKCSGWRDCHYGKNVAGSSWQCNDKQCPDQTCDQTCNQKCKQHPDCGLKSPLQSFLEDGLQGFLPHQFTTPGCKLTCTVSNHRGLPCKTPMGFGELATTASHTRNGAYLRDVLYDFCGDASKPLSRLCGYLVCLVNRPPGTLGEMFGFYYSFIHGWSGSGTHRRDGFNKAVISANFENEGTSLDIAPIFRSSDHKSGNCMPHLTGDLHALVKCTGTTGDAASHPCGPYLRSLCHDIRGIYSETYAAKYLSWIVYLTETFYKLLSMLYDECNSRCGGEKPRCRKSKCISNCEATKWPISPESRHDESCHSIVNCTFTLPTLCKYGLYFENTLDLAGMNGMPLKRTCNDFCTLLKTVLNEKSVLVKLIHAIDNFIWKIREPFSLILLTLWSLSLLYLLHITVVRLDVLRIRSHLRSPSSHRIAAQSLLAAARVKALANVKYFSP
ncbi:hypothetical protein, conserved [Babesia ovata]|uniref:C3H1-type domain-containing protein n=1 Tax=Babesia ovata TaxID=189622 RepID=A0A2H6KAE1_9APIC|nr:uncharacterized protein BOVATA_014510 [Babesia ovata]GBE59958.1 hypothetical protein, conserved [Babesia ovata]